MTLTEKSRALIVKIDAVSKMPLLMRAVEAEKIVRDAVDLVIELSARVQEHTDALIDLRARLLFVEGLPKSGCIDA